MSTQFNGTAEDIQHKLIAGKGVTISDAHQISTVELCNNPDFATVDGMYYIPADTMTMPDGYRGGGILLVATGGVGGGNGVTQKLLLNDMIYFRTQIPSGEWLEWSGGKLGKLLDGGTINELSLFSNKEKATLRDCKKQLDGIARGTTIYDAENARLSGSAVVYQIADGTCSYISGLGANGETTSLAIFEITAETACDCEMDIYYISYESRTLNVQKSSGGFKTDVTCQGNGKDWDSTIRKVTITVPMVVGVNTFIFGDQNTPAPNIARIEISNEDLLDSLIDLDQATSVKSDANLLITQKETVNGVETEAVRKASISALIATLRKNGVNDGYVTEAVIEDMYPDIVKGVEPTETGFTVSYYDGSTQDVTIDNGGLAFDEVRYDQETGYFHILLEGEDVIDPCYIGGGGGSGGSSASYTITIKNLLESRNITEAEGRAVNISFNYASVDSDGVDDGSGVGTIYVGGVKAATVSVNQGDNTIDVSPYLSAGDNAVKIKVENSEGAIKSIAYTVTVVALSMKTTLSELMTCSGDVTFYYTPTGSGTKTIYFIMDGLELGTAEVTSSARSQRYTIPQQKHGGHVFEAYAEMQIGELTLKSNVIRLGMIWVDSTSNESAVVTTVAQATAKQGETLSIPYMAYDPATEMATVALKVLNEDGSQYSSTTAIVDRSGQVWNVQDYPVGNIKLRIELGSTFAEVAVQVSPSEVVIGSIKDGLVFDFNPAGRSNLEANPGHWESEDGAIEATFSGVGFAGSDGWLSTEDGSPMLRLLPGSEMTLPFKLFDTDRRDHGVTVEIEMATHNVRDYDSVVMSCLSNGLGFKIASQYAQFDSEQTEISKQFKEDDRVRVSFVVEPKSLNRLIYVYVNGVMCGAIQYANDDNFQQSPSVGISIGANSSGIDIFRIMMYDGGLSRSEVLSNYIADRPTYYERLEAYKRNDLLDVSEELVITKLPATLPYLIIHCDRLPQYKGDKLTCSVTFVNNSDSSRSFTAEGVQIDVQGTSSAGYKKKNFKLKFKSGIEYTVSMTESETFQMRNNSVPTATFCMKADVASSEGANNVELVNLYEDSCPYTIPPKEDDNRIRVGIDGFPIIIFWNNTSTGETKFWGKYNFNNDKSTAEVFGLTDGCESWEICNNTSDRVIFKKSDYSDAGWTSDFEARYPEDNTDYTKLKRMTDWVVSTDRTAATGKALPSVVEYGGKSYTSDTKEYRFAKFKAEFDDYFVKAPMLFYYLFTEVFLMVDNRAKNFFPTTYDGTHWMPLPYDMDTAIGINNEGKLVIDYDLEDTDELNGGNVFNGQDSVLWCNIRDAFPDDIKEMYAALRNGSTFSYQEVIRRFDAHQSVWPEVVWNEDAYEKYLEPLVSDKDSSYLPMLQGDKESQRDWWLFNGFRYRDSKYQTGDAQSNYITLRCYAVGDITVTPYSHIWPRIKYGSYTVTERGKRNQPTTLVCPLDNMNDTEVYIYSADRLSEIGDLSGMNVGYADFSMATKLQKLKVGDGASSYQNTKMEELYVGNNEMLTEIDFRNCSVLAQNIDLSGCASIQKVLGAGSAIPSVTLPVGGKLQTLELPATITNLTIRNQKEFETLTMPGYESISTLRIENTPNIPIEDILLNSTALTRVRLVDVDWHAESESTLITALDKLENCGGLDATGGNTDKAVISGRLYIPSISADTLQRVFSDFPELVVVVNGAINYLVRYLNYDNTVLYREVVVEGGNATNPVTAGHISAPTRPGTEDTGYAFKDFGTLPTDVHANCTVYATYDVTYRVQFMNGTSVHNTQWVVSGGNATTPSTPSKASTAQYTYTFSGWDKSYTNITAPLTVNAKYTSTLRYYTVYFYNGSTLLQTVANVPYGGSATYTGTTPEHTDDPENYKFNGWSPSNKNIQGDTSCYAQYNYIGLEETIEDDWATIIANIDNGTYATKYSVGDTKIISLGTEGNVTMQIVAIDTDVKADGSGNAPITWVSEYLLKTSHRMNPYLVSTTDEESGTKTYTEGTGAVGGWEKSEMRSYLKDTILPLIPTEVSKRIVDVTKYTRIYNTAGSAVNNVATTENVWIPSYREIFGGTSLETQGVMYTGLFTDATSRIKYKVGASSASVWWLRSADGVISFRSVYSNGYYSYYSANDSYGVALGFCLG